MTRIVQITTPPVGTMAYRYSTWTATKGKRGPGEWENGHYSPVMALALVEYDDPGMQQVIPIMADGWARDLDDDEAWEIGGCGWEGCGTEADERHSHSRFTPAEAAS